MSADYVRCACALLLILVGPVGEAAAEAGSSAEVATGPATQLWANLTLGKMTSRRWYLELDIEPKIQLTSGEEWRNLDLTPLIEFYPSAWLDLEAEIAVGATQ